VRFAIVGCGLIGQKRAAALGGHRLVACADAALERASRLAAQHDGCDATADFRRAIDRPDVDAVIVATTNDALVAVARAAVERGKAVLVEKPAARDTRELAGLIEAAQRAGAVVRVGFNHRFHPAFQRLRRIFDEGGVSELMYIRGRYGHGGRIGYEREWRADPTLAGGGELLDQGVHLIDLARWFAGELAVVAGHVSTYFWRMTVEDNGFALLKNGAGKVAWIHASSTEWKNLFSFELFGRDGKLQVDGLGGSYGVERLTHYRMLPEMGPPETAIWEFPGPDRSWHAELEAFAAAVEGGETHNGSLGDALAALKIVEGIYEVSGCDYRA
jgi:predicted dehydrogenase